MKYYAIILISIFLYACTTMDIPPSAALENTSKQLAVDPSSIDYQRPARFGVTTSGEQFTNFQLGVYTQIKNEVVLFSFDPKTKKLTKEFILPIKEMGHVAIESWGMFNHIKQLQVAMQNKVYAINFTDNSDNIGGSLENTKPAYDKLLSEGAKPGAPFGRILPANLKGFSFPIPTR
jgi:hypothetical protein